MRDIGMVLPIVTFGMASLGLEFQSEVAGASICSYLWTNAGTLVPIFTMMRWERTQSRKFVELYQLI